MKVTIYADGAAKGNPNGPGGFGVILQYIDSSGKLHEKEISKGYKMTTNNRMELLGVITGLESLKKPCDVDLYSDSSYVINAFTQGWIDNWIDEDFRFGKKDQVKNIDLWIRLIESSNIHNITWNWVKGHNGNELNERCDKLASKAALSNNLLDDIIPSDKEIEEMIF